jgi:hypothetical protein
LRQPVEGTGCSLKDFCSHHLESFDGRGDHIRAENWLNDVEELLATLGCTNEQRLAYATYKLTEKLSVGGRIRKLCLSLTYVRRLPFLGKSLNTCSTGTSFLELCKRRRHGNS